MQGDEVAQEAAGDLKDHVTRADSGPMDRERSTAGGPFSGMAEDQSYQQAGIKECLSHRNRGGRLELESQSPRSPELRRCDPRAMHQSVWLEQQD